MMFKEEMKACHLLKRSNLNDQQALVLAASRQEELKFDTMKTLKRIFEGKKITCIGRHFIGTGKQTTTKRIMEKMWKIGE